MSQSAAASQAQDDVARIIRQEQELVYDRFDEAAAFALGSRIRALGVERKLTIVCDIRTWDRQLFFAALPGTSADNSEWVRRKINLVRRFLKSSYRVVRERNQPDRLLPPHMAMSQDEYALAGGGFPIRVKGAGIIGTVTVSGLPERDDHGLVIEALALELGHDPASYALPALVG